MLWITHHSQLIVLLGWLLLFVIRRLSYSPRRHFEHPQSKFEEMGHWIRWSKRNLGR
ncbi:uncharacterized protein RAG0_10080 [Rhynchosporium agropyri]|uniref:Uncharacterized protein n=1 Tax=Rhynchosporium agropyri TaxID=914238 RepID=A0A1E1KYF5_9HELO|nr:uncharacterized protein RAG0_10080 [Rhynchosporium agropyri]